MKTFYQAISELLNPEEFRKLANIGGHKVYHLEGNALTHTKLVWSSARARFGDDDWLTKTALLHDIGKIYTSICHGENDWEYPDHTICGSLRGILSKFISESDPMFKAIQWMIRNHLKPMFWKEGKIDTATPAPAGFEEYCTIENLAKLALCDLEGSYSVEDQSDLKEFIYRIAYPNTDENNIFYHTVTY